jgi:glucose-1-phosphate cytidylyltransferase
MQVIIFCGGKGTRMWPYTETIPKPLMPVGERPVLWHIMKMYSHHGHKDFVLCIGEHGEKIREYFDRPENREADWKIQYDYAGDNALKIDKLKHVQPLVKDDTFLVSYGDDVSDVDINKVIAFHKESNKMITLTAVPLFTEFGIMDIAKGGTVRKFKEKPKLDFKINGGFFVFDRKVFDHLDMSDELESATFRKLADANQVMAYEHDGFWACMNTKKDMDKLNELWSSGRAPWAVWKI